MSLASGIWPMPTFEGSMGRANRVKEREKGVEGLGWGRVFFGIFLYFLAFFGIFLHFGAYFLAFFSEDFWGFLLIFQGVMEDWG